MAASGVNLCHRRYCYFGIFVVLFAVNIIQGRPQDSKEESSESSEWQHNWNPTSDKDKWRAFEPSHDVTTTRWWEQKLDDNLWDPRPQQDFDSQEEKGEKISLKIQVTSKPNQVDNIKSEVTSKPSDIVPEKSEDLVTEKQDGTVSITSKPETQKQDMATFSTGAPVPVTVKPTVVKSAAEIGYPGGYYRKAELNTFVEPDLGTYYRESDSYNSKPWDATYSSSSDSAESKETKSTEQKADSSELEKEDSVQIDAEATTKLTKPNVNKVTTQPTSNVNSSKTNLDLKTQQASKTTASSKADVSVKPVAEESNSIYGKGESIGAPALGSVSKATEKVAAPQKMEASEKVTTVISSQKPDEKLVKNSQNDFVDWADWDSSLFDGYQDDEEDEEMSKDENVANENKSEKVKKMVKASLVEEKKISADPEISEMKTKPQEVANEETKKLSAESNDGDKDLDVKNVQDIVPVVKNTEDRVVSAVKNVEEKVVPEKKNEKDKTDPAFEKAEVKDKPEVKDKTELKVIPDVKNVEITKVPAVKSAASEESEFDETDDFDEDDVDDEYYDDWEDEWDEDIKLEGEVKDATPATTTTTSKPIKAMKEKKSRKGKSEQKSKQVINLDTAAQQASKLVTKVDQSHYSKGVIYDANFPNHKSSVKKDLSNPSDANTESIKNLALTEPTDKIMQDPPNNSLNIPTEKKDSVKLGGSKKVAESKAAVPEDRSKEEVDSSEESYEKELKKNTVISNVETNKHADDKVGSNSVMVDNVELNLSKESKDKVIKKEPSPMNKLTVDSVAADTIVLKKEPSVTFFHPSQMNTESDASTSPNPPPPGLATDKGSLSGSSANTTPGPKGQQQKSTDSTDDYIISYPIEFCQVDYECRAGRMCVKGVCKCVPSSVCAGHHKPICGSDGVRYSSHCEMHRTACVNRVHIRQDRKGNCFQEELKSKIANKEKSWILEQKSTQSVHIPSQEIYNFPEDIKKGSETSDIKKAIPTEGGDKQLKKAPPAPIKKDCSWEEMAQFKEALLMYYCQKFVEPNCKVEVKTDRAYLSMLMFSYYDQNFDYFLTASELDDKERAEHFDKNIIVSCHLHDFVKYADTADPNGKLTVSEFTQAFEISAPKATSHSKVEVISTLASAGNGLELKCGLEGATNVVWKRFSTQLVDDKHSHQLMVFDDGALFFSKVGLHHVGNYTCMDAEEETNMQVHRLQVQTLPVLTVDPVTQIHMTGSDIELRCHAEGVPKPIITWKQGGDVVNSSSHVTHYFGGGHIVIHNAQVEADSGSFTCSAHNQAGTTEKTVSVSVVPPTNPAYKSSMKETGTFMVFNDKGIQSYDPLHCLLKHQIRGDFGNFKFIPDALDGPLTLCRSGQDCQWGSAAIVGSNYIYASQPDQNRVVIVETGTSWSPVQVIDTDKKPIKMWYVKHLDQVWVLCANQEDSQGGKTIVVIRDASQHIQHRAVHTRPVGNHFDTVQDVFIAKPNDLEHEFDFGYVTHRDQNGLFKLNLEDMSYTKSIDLSNYGCVPTYLDFVPIGGHVLIQCVSSVDHHTLQLTMDYLTDTVISTVSLSGRPMTSPDSRHLVTVDESTGKVTVSSVSDEGIMETTYEVTVSARISDVTFVPANSHHGYDLVLTSADDDDVILMNLVTGKVEKITGTQFTDPAALRHPSSVHRLIVPSDTMNNYLMTPSKSTLAILDIKFKVVECEFTDTVGSSVMLYTPSSKTS
ncbi:eisosome protein SEG2 [Biomphalaria pfeifferi]|uniref:Eisosome protein SEG2 n=1 Tax=Biomphalaria pfeifferi TaxID=112525 RepID=A0AAD8F5K4_BIOPF|nr:eisosome protein SEG2 [Biomphalaria pfeifferi]